MTYPDHLQKQLDIIFNCAPGPHEIRILGQRYQVLMDGQSREYHYDKGFSIGAPKNTQEAISIVNAHFYNGIRSNNCYIVLNRVSDEYTISTKRGKIGNTWHPAMGYFLTKESDIRAYCALAIDIDRTNKTNQQGEKQVASEEELQQLKAVMNKVCADLAQFELHPNYKLMSGNGFQMAYFFEHQFDIRETKGIVKMILYGLHEKYLKEEADIDTSLSDPSRVVRLAGTWNMKDLKENPAEHRCVRQAQLVEDPRKEINSYQNIKKLVQTLASSVEHHPKNTAKTVDSKRPKIYRIPQQNGKNGNWIDDRLRLGGRELLIRALRQIHNNVQMEGEIKGKLQLLCPYHDDHRPSAWIDENDHGISMIHCKTDTCALHNNSKTALKILTDGGWNFQEACHELFGEVPPVSCKYCSQQIVFDGESKRPLNPDRSPHACEEYKKQKTQESIHEKQEEQKKREPIPERQEDDDNRPTILLEGDLEIKSREILSWLNTHNVPPCIFTRGREIVRLVQIEGEDKRVKQTVIERMDGKKLRAFLNERIRFEKEVKKQDEITIVTSDLPLSVADNILSRSSWLFPDLMEIVRHPSLDCEGNLILKDGYNASMQAWVDLAGFQVEVPESPTTEEITCARTLILDELLINFPFLDKASKANAVALGLLPFVRHLIQGCTPLHLIGAPTPASGKSLLSEILSLVAIGSYPASITEGKSDDEWRKRITAILEQSPTIIRIDNVTNALDSGNLSSVLTTKIWSDRRLGSTAMITLRNNAVWVITANNPQLSMEVARRCVWISLDPKVEQPWKRENFKHDPIRKWVKANRVELVKAFLILAQAWIKAGRPISKVRIGSFEEWAEIIGGILEVAGIEGFLENHEKLCLRADIEMREWRAFVELWWEQCSDCPVAVKELRVLAMSSDLLARQIGDKDDRSQHIRLGKALEKMQDRIIGCWRIEQADFDKHRKMNMWRLVKVADCKSESRESQ